MMYSNEHDVFIRKRKSKKNDLLPGEFRKNLSCLLIERCIKDPDVKSETIIVFGDEENDIVTLVYHKDRESKAMAVIKEISFGKEVNIM